MVDKLEGCANCAGTGWVCENHRDRPWDGHTDVPRACGCGAGAPCHKCVPPSRFNSGGRFLGWSISDLAAQCLAQAREQLDPEFSQFMTAVAARLGGTSPTPTEDARERVKALEEALEPFAAVAEYMGGKNGIITGYNHTNVTYEHFRRARTALGNKETDRHG